MSLPYQIGYAVPNFVAPPRPDGIRLEGESVSIVPLDVEAHSEALWQAYGQNAHEFDWVYLPYGPFESYEHYRAWLASVAGKNDPVFFTMIDKFTAAPAGVASYLRIDPNVGSIEIGHINYSRALQRSIAASEAQFLMMDWVFSSGYRRYEWKCDALNLRSRRSANRLGFSYEGIFRQATIYKGRNRDTAWFAITDRDWPAIREAYLNFLAPDNFDADGTQRLSLTELTRPLLFKVDDGLLDGQ